jgi:hypothetical protein
LAGTECADGTWFTDCIFSADGSRIFRAGRW